jgi:hypothetical protein
VVQTCNPSTPEAEQENSARSYPQNPNNQSSNVSDSHEKHSAPLTVRRKVNVLNRGWPWLTCIILASWEAGW